MLNVSEQKGGDAKFSPIGFVDGPSTKRLKIAFSTTSIMGTETDADVKAALEVSAALCAEMGHEVVEAKAQIEGEVFMDHFVTAWAQSPYELVKNARIIGLMQLRWIGAEEGLEPWTRGLAELFRQKERANPGIVDRAVSYFDEMAAMYSAFFADYDVALTPVLRSSPLPIGDVAPSVDFDTLYERVLDYVSYTPQHNAAGLPAISLPLFTGANGLPVGSQFAANHGNERTLLELAYELEAARPWASRWPSVSALNTQ